MHYKGYDVPSDLGLILDIFLKVRYYRRAVHQHPLPALIEKIKLVAKGSLHIPDTTDHINLNKAARAADFLLLRIIRTEKPCLPRSLALLHWCGENGIQARIAIGVKRSQQLLEGHSWLLIEDQPFREDLDLLAEYTIMLEGSN